MSTARWCCCLPPSLSAVESFFAEDELTPLGTPMTPASSRSMAYLLDRTGTAVVSWRFSLSPPTPETQFYKCRITPHTSPSTDAAFIEFQRRTTGLLVHIDVPKKHAVSAFSPEDVGSMFFRNVIIYLQVSTALQPRR